MTPVPRAMNNGSGFDLETFVVMENHSNAMGVEQQTPFLDTPTFLGLVNAQQLQVYENVMGTGINTILALVGIVNNILTLTVFVRMGFKESVNISMTVLTIWYLVTCICIVISKLSDPLTLVSNALGTSWKNVSTLTSGTIYSISVYASGVLATFIAIERCLCISKPLMVKHLLTRTFVTGTCVALSLAVAGSYVINLASFEMVSVTNPVSNETIVIFRFNSLHTKYPGIQAYIHFMSIFYPFASFCISCVCTVIIVYHLRKASRFRSDLRGRSETTTTTTTTEPAQLSSRDRQVIKMLLVITIIYMICIIPRIVFFLGLRFVPGFYARSRYNNLFWIGISMTTTFGLIDASVNIYIFYFMSSQFNHNLKQILHLAPQTMPARKI